MSKYLFTARLTHAGVQGMMQDGGTKREAVVRGMIESLGGTLEAFYYAFGGADIYCICDMPDHVSAAAALTVAAGGGATVETVVLLSAAEIDAATKKTPAYKPPGN